MAVQKNFVVRHGLEVNTDLIYADNYENRVGIGTTNMLEKLHVDGGVYVSEDINARNINLTGVSSISTINSTNVYVTNAYINTGIVTNISGTRATYTTGSFATGNIVTGVVTTLTSTNGTITNLTGTAVTYTRSNITNGTITNLTGTAGTITTFNSTNGTITNLTGTAGTITTFNSTNGTITNGTITNASGSTLNYSGIATVNSISIGSTEVISSSRQLKNITSLDATTTSTIETAIANAPNNFTDIRVTGVSTFTNGPILVGTGTSTGTENQDLQVNGGVYISSHVGLGTTTPTNALTVIGDALVSGFVTATTFFGDFHGTDLYINGTGFFTSSVTASSFVGDLSGSSSGLTGMPSILVMDLDVVGNSIFEQLVSIGSTSDPNYLTVFGNASISGILTANTFVGDLTGTASNATYANTAGIATYATKAGIATYSTSSGISSTLNANANVNTTGIITATGGFISVGNTTPIQISLVGDTLTFTAPGVGSTSLTLY